MTNFSVWMECALLFLPQHIKPNHLCFTAEEIGFRAGLNGVCKIFLAFLDLA